MKKILIIGSRGMLGQELIKIFKKDSSWKVTAWNKKDIDITNEKLLEEKISDIKPDFIINSAAYNDLDKAEDDFETAKLVNAAAPGYLAKIAKKIGAVLVHYSTDYVFDGEINSMMESQEGCGHSCSSCPMARFEFGYDEESKPNPISKYGKSKLLGEKEVQKNTKEFYLIRLSRLFGKPAKSEGAKKSFFDVMLDLGKSKPKNKKIKLVDEEISCFTYAPDLAKKTKEIIDAKKPFGIYHIVNSNPCTWYEATLELYRQVGINTDSVVPVGRKEFPQKAKRPVFSVLANTKLNPLRGYEEALKDYLKSIKKKK